jgi:hypothetical protein
MGIHLDVFRKNGDVFIDHDFEEVMFRWEAATGRIFRKFYGSDEEVSPIDRTNRLFNDALNLGEEIDFDTYSRGRAQNWTST